MLHRLTPFAVLLVLTACGADADPVDDTASRSPEATPSKVADDGCPDVVVIGVRGQGQSPDRNFGAGTEVRLLATEVKKRLDGQGVRFESIDYPSDPPPEIESYRSSVAAGARALDRRIDRWEQRCADTRLVVLGFSQGANVAHEAVHDREPGSIAAVGIIADPARDPDGDIDELTFGGTAPHPGSVGRGSAYGAIASRVVGFCHPEDDVCSHTAGTPLTAGNQVHKHFYERPAATRAMADRVTALIESA